MILFSTYDCSVCRVIYNNEILISYLVPCPRGLMDRGEFTAACLMNGDVCAHQLPDFVAFASINLLSSD